MKMLLFALVLALIAGSAAAQTFGEITGRVNDPSGAAVPGAAISVTNVATNAVRQTVTADSGNYAFPSLPPGTYRVRMEHPGFKASTSDNIDVQVQQSVRLDATLQLGQVSETVEVAAHTDLLQAENATLGAVVENKMITELPLNGRQYLNLVALAPNVNTLAPAAGQAGSRQGGDRAAQAISTGGQRIMFDYYTLDGVNNTDPNFNTYVVLPSIDAIQEFKVQIGVYPAEYGHQSTQVNVLTKSGGNAYHGALFEFLRNNKMDAQSYAFSAAQHVPTTPFKWNDYGFELDGPVRIPKVFNGRDKLFFMANYEALRRRQSAPTNYTLPTQAQLNGDFSSLSAKIYDPTTTPRTQFLNNVIPTTRLDPVSLRLLKYYPAAATSALTNNYTQFNSSPSNRDGLVTRMDFVESSKSQWSARYSWGDENQKTAGLSLTGSKLLTNYEQYAVSNTRILTPNLVNEARYGYTRFFNSVGRAAAFDQDIVGQIAIPGLKSGDPVTWGIPQVNFSGTSFSGLGDDTEGPYANDNNTMQVLEKLSWIKGKHTFRFGFEYNRQNYNQVGNQFSRGQFNFQANATRAADNSGGNALAEFLLGNPFSATVAVAIANARFQRNSESAYIDDTWKVTPKLTLSLGLRYELTPPFTNTLGDYFTVAVPKITFDANTPVSDYPYFVRQGNCTDPYAGLNIRWTSTKAVCSNGLLDNNLMETKYKNFAPRIGIAYSPDSKTVVRAGLGIFYNQDTGNAGYFDMARNIAGRVTLNATPGVATLNWANSVAGGNGALAQIPPPYSYVAAYDHATSYTTQYLLNIQRQFGKDWVIELGYLGSESHHLYGFQNLNQATPANDGTTIASRTAFKNIGVIQYVSDGLNAAYNSGSIKATRRFSQGLSFTSSYTYSKSTDESSGVRPQGFDTLFPQDNRCLSCEHALSAFDTRHRFILAASYDLPVGKSKALNISNAVLDAVIGGWQTSGNYTLQSGVPQTLSIGGVDNASTGNQGTDRPNYTGVGNGYAAVQTPSRWYDPNSFVRAPAGTFGNVGRNTMITPHFRGLDFAVHKNFRMPWEGHSLQFRAEAFNVLNHPSWGAPGGNIASANFGVINSTGIPMRQLQMGLKYSF